MKRLLISLGAALVLCTMAGVGIASAQTTPPASTSTSGSSAVTSTTVAQAPAKKDPKKKPFMILHITPMATYNIGGADLPRPAYECSGGTCGATGNYEFAGPATNLGYGANINFAPGWTLNYVHGYVNQNIGTITNYKGVTTYQQFNNDRTDDASIGHSLGSVALAAGWHERVRQCCGNPPKQSDAGQTAYHYWYVQGTEGFGPGSKYFGKMFSLTLQAAYEPHVPSAPYYANPACLAYATAAQCKTPPYEVPGEGNKFHGLYNIHFATPIGGKASQFGVFAQYLNNWDYFDNQPIMFLYNEADYGIVYKFTPLVTLSAMNSNLYQHQAGYPFVLPNTVNRNKLYMTLDFALPVY
ncbi:MAG TPA: hypothetical protein VMV65_11165 [Alphaproteobacteria bacterium]|nr:hypothetical protein [Alphaproteobacteria bacterium]